MRTFWGRTLSLVKYALALFMIASGFMTMFQPVPPDTGHFGWAYAHRISLVIIGLCFIGSGLTLFIGKILKNMKVIGVGLLCIYLCFFYAAMINFLALGFPHGWENGLCTILVGILWIRWNYLYRTGYTPGP